MNDDKIVIKFPFGFGLFYFLLGIAVLFLSLCFFTDGVAEDRILAFITLIAGVLSARFGIYIFRYRLEISPLGCIYRTLWKQKNFIISDIAVLKLRVIPIPRYAMTSMKTEAYDKNGHLIFTLKDGRKFTEVLKELCRINVPIEVISGMDVYAPILEGTASWESLKTRMSEDMNTQGPCAKPALSMQNAIGYSQEPAAKMKPRIFLTVFPVIIVLLMIFCMAVWGQNSGSSPTDEQGQAMEI